MMGSALAKGGFNIPTDLPASPLFGAQPFTQQMLRFEEFGPEPMPAPSNAPAALPLPQVGALDGTVCSGAPNGAELDAFLAEPLHPTPTIESNIIDPNPWAAEISTCLGREVTGVAEGRPPGVDFSHQRWDEFTPVEYFQTAQAGARTNGGLRDSHQKHQYAEGEFGPGGLYHNTVGVINPTGTDPNATASTAFDGTTAGIDIRLHPLMPIQFPRTLSTFDGTLPPKLLKARYGIPLLFRHFNALPIDPAANNGFGTNTISTHEHNGHHPAESDGFAGAFFFPGEYYDYRWPMVLAGHDTINVNATDPRAATPDGNGGTIKIPGDYRETMSTHWFHDHMIDFTAQNVYKGNAVMMNYYSAIDRGNEGLNCNYNDPTNVNLCFPSGTGLDWGNRDYDVQLLVADKATDQNGQLIFNPFNTDGFLGDMMTVNWLYKPYFEVRARKYRFRILNGSVSRYIKLALVDEAGNRVPFYMIANDGNILEHAIRFPTGELPTQSIAERYDIIVDFSGFAPGSKLYLVNLMEHKSGIGPNRPIGLANVLSGAYDGDPVVGKFLEFHVNAYSGTDLSMNPADYIPGRRVMIKRPTITDADLASAVHRTFEFGRSGGTGDLPWTIKTDGGTGLTADVGLVSAAPEQNQWEIWHIVNGGNGWSHPVHVHFEEGQILQRDNAPPPIWEQYARKDVYRIGPEVDSSTTVDVAIRFREFLGTYVEHCHNTQHEDHAMLLRWDAQNNTPVAIQTPVPDWDGVLYEASVELPTAHTGDLNAAADFVPPPQPVEVTDTVTIRRAVLLATGRLSASGLVTSTTRNVISPSVEVFTGLSNGTTCPGTSLGTADVTTVNPLNGRWVFTVVPAPDGTTDVCVKSADGGVADATLTTL